MLCFPFMSRCYEKATLRIRILRANIYKPIDIRGKSIINDTASNHRVMLLTHSKVRGTDRCERRRGEPKNQDMSCEIINFQILYRPAAP